MIPTDESGSVLIDKRDFDPGQSRPYVAHRRRETSSSLSADHGGRDSTSGLLSEVVEGIMEQDRRKLEREAVKLCSFIWGVASCLGAGSITAFSLYGPLLLTRLHYTQFRVNTVSIAAELAMYLPVSLFGVLCDRYSPSPLSLLSGILFGSGYLLAAFTYKSGPPPAAGGTGWPFWAMIVAFVLVGAGTSCLYLAAVTTCAKNFGRGKYKGIMLAVPIAAFGLSGMWQSQVGTYLLCEKLEDGSCGDVDVFRYFLFLGFLLLGIGIIGTFALRIVDEEEEKYIDEAVEELARSGIIDESSFFRSRSEIQAAYGTFLPPDDGDSSADDESQRLIMSDEECNERRREKDREEGERRKKSWLLNYETRLFLGDNTMWWLAIGFFLITGPGEAYINNLGTVIQTLTPRSYPLDEPLPAGRPSTHVTIIAVTSTIARLLTGSLTDIFAPSTAAHRFPGLEQDQAVESSRPSRFTLSRLAFLLPSAFLLSLGYLLLAAPFMLQVPQLFYATTALVGTGYGATFSLVPILISAVWGVENFGTNWGIVAMVPAVGAAMWGLIYSAAYQNSINEGEEECHGWSCYGLWAVGCTVSVWIAIVAWLCAWRGWKRRGIIV